MLKLRPYQEEAINSVYQHLATKETSPCIVLPTGSGKSLVMAWMLKEWKERYPPFRACVLAHRKELVQQNSAELAGIWPLGDIGVFAASLRRRDYDAAILFASIDTIYDKFNGLAPFDVLIVDEAHRIPARGEGKYRQFIKGCKKINPNLRVVGLTATPYRMGCGPICHRDHILNEVVYEANVADLIAEGYLSRLRSKVSEFAPDLEKIERNHGGDYKVQSMHEATAPVVQEAVHEAASIIMAEQRRAAIFFCVDVEHCHTVSLELRKYGINAPAVTGKTPIRERGRYAKGFIEGRYNALCNVNVFTEGFNAKRVDCVVLLRPTLSMGLYSQMVGRGLRTHPGKKDCLVLDYAHCIQEHGPIDCLDAGEVKLQLCADCGDTFSRAIRVCPNCGWEIPPIEYERMEAEDKEKRLHEARAAQISILGDQPLTVPVDDVRVDRHVKAGSPDSIRVTYRSGLSTYREWICLDHPGWAGEKARRWWSARFGREQAMTIDVDGALQNLFLAPTILNYTETITVRRNKKHMEIIGYGYRQPAS